MKRIKVFLSIVGICLMAQGAADGRELKIVTAEFCPYVCNVRDARAKPGFVIDIFKAIFEDAGYTVKLEVQPWTRALKTFNDNKGEFDGLIAATRLHPVDKAIAVFPDIEICRYTHQFYAPKDSPLLGKWEYQGLESLTDIKLGCVKGWSYSSIALTEYVNDPPPGASVYAMHGEKVLYRNLRMLLRGNTDLYVENQYMVDYFFHQKNEIGEIDPDQIVAVDNVPVDKGAASSYPVFYQEKNGEQYARIFSQGIKKLRKSGKLDPILAAYGLTDWR